jgi:hypothetical protein
MLRRIFQLVKQALEFSEREIKLRAVIVNIKGEVIKEFLPNYFLFKKILPKFKSDMLVFSLDIK